MGRTWGWRKVELVVNLEGAEVEGVKMTEVGGQRGGSDRKGGVLGE